MKKQEKVGYSTYLTKANVRYINRLAKQTKLTKSDALNNLLAGMRKNERTNTVRANCSKATK